jgi:hypothetical protein
VQANQIHLTTNLSEPLLELLRDGPVPFDGVEVGPWFTVREIRAYRQMLPDLPFDGYHFEAQPARITMVIERTGCGWVLDIGHARVAAHTLGMDIHDYVTALPLERVVQVHVSGVRERGGRLIDAHEPLQGADYALLRYLLERAHPRTVTLEYIHERGAVLDQLVRLRDLLESVS